MAFDLITFAQEWAKPIGQIVGGPAAGAITGWFLGRKQQRNAEANASAAQTNAVTERFKTLMDGYENRIKDLLAEVERLRVDLRALQDQLSNRQGFGL